MLAPGLDKHVPIFTKENGKIVYNKTERNLKDFIFRKTWAVTINGDILAGRDSSNNPIDLVRITFILKGKPVVIEATRQAIEAHKTVHNFYNESKWEYPMNCWKVVSGPANWHETIKSFAW